MKKVAFVFSTTIGNSGGIKIAFEYASCINKNGIVQCDIIYPIIPGNYKLWKFKKIKSIYKFFGTIIFNIFKYNYKKYKNMYNNVNIIRVKTLNDLNKLNYDTIIAASWESTYYINNLSCKKKYFVQSYETWNGPNRLVQDTYNNNRFEILTITNFLRNILKKVHKRQSSLLYNPIYIRKTKENIVKSFDNIIYGIVYRNIAYKHFEIIIDFLKKNLEYRNKFICIGQNVPKKYYKYFKEVMDGSSYENMKEFYKKINTLIVTSNNEGFGLPIIEAMSFGNIVICKQTGILFDLGKNKINYMKINCNDELNESFNGVFKDINLEELESAIHDYEQLSKDEKENLSRNSLLTVNEYIEELNIKNNIKYFLE